MGHEAGQPLTGIIARKDAERALGAGLFFWGIGTALGQRFWNFVDGTPQPSILFSPMKSKAQPVDVKPDKVFVWTAYIDRRGIKHNMPEHALVTSRGVASKGGRSNHYALVCRKLDSLIDSPRSKVEWTFLRNFEGSSRLGFSQVTAVVEMESDHVVQSSSYDVLFDAELTEPYYVRLADPVQLPANVLHEVNNLWADGCQTSEWASWLRNFREKFLASTYARGELELPLSNRST